MKSVILKSAFVASVLLPVSLPAAAWQFEAGLLAGSGNYDTDDVQGDFDYSVTGLFADLYFSDINSDAVLAEQAFIAQASGVYLGVTKQEVDDLDRDLDSRFFGTRIVFGDQPLIFELDVDQAEVDDLNLESDSVTLGFGAYFTDHSALVGRIGSYEQDDNGFVTDLGVIGVNYEHYAVLKKSKQAIKFYADLEVAGGEDDADRDIAESTATIGVVFYLTDHFGLGFESQGYAVDDDIDECSRSSLAVSADWFATENLRFYSELSGSAEECDIAPEEPTNGLFVIGIAGRI